MIKTIRFVSLNFARIIGLEMINAATRFMWIPGVRPVSVPMAHPIKMKINISNIKLSFYLPKFVYGDFTFVRRKSFIFFKLYGISFF